MSVPKLTQEKAIAAVKDLNPGMKDFQLLYEIPSFLQGLLLVVRFRDESDKYLENHVYLAGEMTRVAKNPSQFAHMVAEEAKRKTAFAHFMDVGGIAGLIAILITLTIGYMVAVQGAKEVPTFLSTALATILGFYFGTRSTKGGT